MKIYLVALLLLLSPTGATQENRRMAKIRGAWSGEAVSLLNTWGAFDDNPGRRLQFFSPDRTVKVIVKDTKVSLWIRGKEFKTDFGYRTNAELGWSPDSKKFFLTWTDGGETGTWHVAVFDVSEGEVKEIKGLGAKAKRDFAQRVRKAPKDRDAALWNEAEYCEPNVVASQWFEGSSELLISVLVPNTSSCRRESDFNVYRIQVPNGAILGRYTAEQAHRRFNPKNLPKIMK